MQASHYHPGLRMATRRSASQAKIFTTIPRRSVTTAIRSRPPADFRLLIPRLFPFPCLAMPASRVLFQGDSITDGRRSRDDHPSHCLGDGYVLLVAADVTTRESNGNVFFLNRGISGNRIEELTARWHADTLSLRPDLLSILIGVNDVWHRTDAGQPFQIDDFARQYEALLAATVSALPETQLVLCEPFFLPGPATDRHFPLWQRHLADQQALVARLARQFHATHVGFQAVFDAAVKQAPPARWLWDGVHPTPAGHRLLADEWLSVAGHHLG